MMYAPDMTDEGAFQRRQSLSEKHLGGAKNVYVFESISESSVS